MKIHCLKSGRDEDEFFKKLEEYDEEKFELLNVVPRGNRLMAILKEKPAPQDKPRKVAKKIVPERKPEVTKGII